MMRCVSCIFFLEWSTAFHGFSFPLAKENQIPIGKVSDLLVEARIPGLKGHNVQHSGHRGQN